MDLRIAPLTVQRLATDRLRDAILAGHFKPGERLTEANLCAMMEVSRSSVREALRHLEAERLIVIVPNRGPSVAEITWTQAEEIYRVRALLEGEVAALFAERATPPEIECMRQALDGFASAVAERDPIGRIETTREFYDVMLGGCGNSIICEVLTALLARINYLRGRSMSQPGRARFSAIEMRAILTAIKKKDSEAARAAAIAHVNAACEAARSVFATTKAA
jgi:DNA-binding GntR family transcriptional regulator